MQITLNTEELSERDRNILAFIAGGGTKIATPEEAVKPAAAAKPAAKAAKPKAEEPAAPAEESSDGPTLDDAVAAATKLVSEGKAKDVKAALEAVGAKRVSELAEGDIQTFLDAISG